MGQCESQRKSLWYDPGWRICTDANCEKKKNNKSKSINKEMDKKIIKLILMYIYIYLFFF